MEEFGEGNRESKKITIVSLAILVVAMVVGTSYALWQLTFTQTGTNVITTGCLNLTLIDDTDAINLTDATPIGDEEGKKLVPYNFTLENTCNTETSYIINLETVSQGDKILADNYVKANLIKGTDEVFIDKLIESHENQDKVIEEASVAYMLNQGKLAGKEKVQFSLRLWMDEDTPALDEVMSATWQGKITITASYVPKVEENDKELYNIVKNRASLDNVASEFVTSSTGIDFGVAPSDTNGKGVYTIASTKDNEYPVHYFRGAVTNNNVKFANFCWKIVRTTETGGVKLIYNGLPDENGKCNNTKAILDTQSSFNINPNEGNKTGYMYNNNNSPLKLTIDTWYKNNMLSYTKYLEDTVWCNDQSEAYEFANIYYYGFYERYIENENGEPTNKPSLVCSQPSNRYTVNTNNGNGKLTYPTATLTGDEAWIAGTNEYSYLSSNYDWWTLSPAYTDTDDEYNNIVHTFAYGENIFHTNITDVKGIRPAISLAVGTIISSGDGTASSPYEILAQ